MDRATLRSVGRRIQWGRWRGTPLAFAGGMAAVASYLGCTTAAWWLYPRSFSPLHNWLSDLGDSLRNPHGAMFYNVGCVLTGSALLFFILGLSRWRSGHSTRDGLITASQIAGVIAACSLAMVGVYSQDLARQHLSYSNSFFSCFPISIVLLSSALIARPRSRAVGVLGFVVVLVGLAFHSLFPVSRPLEWVTESGFLLFVGLVAWSTQRELASPRSW